MCGSRAIATGCRTPTACPQPRSGPPSIARVWLLLSPLLDTLLRSGEFMAKYMYQASYTLEGVRGLLKETASGRRKAIESAIVALGGKVESFYYCFGKDDVILIMDLPNNVSA